MLAGMQREVTTSDASGYPRYLKVVYTTDTMEELREAKEAAEEAGAEVDVIRMHRRDGWNLWCRSMDADLSDDAWTGEDGRTMRWTLPPGEDREALAFEIVMGDDGRDIRDVEALRKALRGVEDLAGDIPEPDERDVYLFVDDELRIAYTVEDGHNGYSYDTHHYRTGLIVTWPEDGDE